MSASTSCFCRRISGAPWLLRLGPACPRGYRGAVAAAGASARRFEQMLDLCGAIDLLRPRRITVLSRRSTLGRLGLKQYKTFTVPDWPFHAGLHLLDGAAGPRVRPTSAATGRGDRDQRHHSRGLSHGLVLRLIDLHRRRLCAALARCSRSRLRFLRSISSARSSFSAAIEGPDLLPLRMPRGDREIQSDAYPTVHSDGRDSVSYRCCVSRDRRRGPAHCPRAGQALRRLPASAEQSSQASRDRPSQAPR